MSGFKDFYQYVAPTRVVAGRGLIEGLGFEFIKEGAKRVAMVTDAVMRGTGLVDRVEAGVANGGLEVAGVFDGVPRTRPPRRGVGRPRRPRPRARTRSWLSAAARSWTRPRSSNVIFAHGGEPHE